MPPRCRRRCSPTWAASAIRTYVTEDRLRAYRLPGGRALRTRLPHCRALDIRDDLPALVDNLSDGPLLVGRLGIHERTRELLDDLDRLLRTVDRSNAEDAAANPAGTR